MVFYLSNTYKFVLMQEFFSLLRFRTIRHFTVSVNSVAAWMVRLICLGVVISSRRDVGAYDREH